MKKRKIKKILLISLLVLAAAVLAIALSSAEYIGEVFEFGVIKSEIMGLVIVFLIMIPILLFIIILAWIAEMKKNKEEKIDIVISNPQIPTSKAQPRAVEEKKESAITEKAEENSASGIFA